MKNEGSWSGTKRFTTIALAVLLIVDVGLGVFLWQSSRQNPEELRAQRETLALQAKLRKAEVERGRRIRASLPQIGLDCDKFYKDTFLDPATGYSAVESDFNTIADKAGLRTSATNFKEKVIKDHGVTELQISTTVDGSYSSVIQFINGLEQSKIFYLLNDLHLTSATAGAVKLQLDLRTYFRT
ncbi:MAG TPA: hypothetical protein VMH00_06770 [Candidatus Limnocylindrales bacterium]|nr:hypothetical protein [Candidatus Limnocylindrales bacterium]